MRRNGVIKFLLPESTLGSPYVIPNFFPPEMFARVKAAVNALNIGPNGRHKYHTMMGRWEESIKLDEDIESYCLEKARKIFSIPTLKKSFCFVSRYQIHEGCIPSLWEHYDQGATQATIDITIDNPANWDLTVERINYKQLENHATVFAGQQQLHARPPYPTDDPSLYGTFLFFEFTDLNHWAQNSAIPEGLKQYGNDGDVRYFNRNRFMALPDSPIEQPICGRCHDYSTVFQIYNAEFGEYIDDDIELVDMTFFDRTILAPGIVQYSILENSSITLNGLTRNVGFKTWERVLPIDSNKNNLFSYSLTNAVKDCHPHDPALRLYESLNKGIDTIMRDYQNIYNIPESKCNFWTLLRREPGSGFCGQPEKKLDDEQTVLATVILNDDFFGGEIGFEKSDVVVKPKKGTVIISSYEFGFIKNQTPIIRGNSQIAIGRYVKN